MGGGGAAFGFYIFGHAMARKLENPCNMNVTCVLFTKYIKYVLENIYMVR